MTGFSAVLSLGAACATSFAITDYFQDKRAISPFDWLVTPLPSLISILDDRGIRFGRRFLSALDGTTTLCREYGVYYHHEFDHVNRAIAFDAEAIERCRQKLQHKMGRFLSTAAANRTLFVRSGLGTDIPGDEYEVSPVPASILNNLAKQLECTSGRDDFVIACLVRNGTCDGRKIDEKIEFDVRLDPRIEVFQHAVYENYPSRGDRGAYQKLFEGFQLFPHSRISGDNDADKPLF